MVKSQWLIINIKNNQNNLQTLVQMEYNPDIVSFEDFIKQQSDDFRMYPSKRVWYSLYNNLHPGRKWPSISMCIVLLTTLFLVGYLNTRDTHGTFARHQLAKNSLNTDLTFANNSFSVILNEYFLSTLNFNSKTDNLILENSADIPSIYLAKLAFSKNKSNILVSATNNDYNTNISGDENLSAISSKSSFIDKRHWSNSNLSSSTSAVTKAAGGDGRSSSVPKQIQAANTTTFAINTNNNIDPGKNINVNEEILTEKEGLFQRLSKRLSNEIKINVIALPVEATANNSISETVLTKIAIGTDGSSRVNKTSVNQGEKSWIENYALYNKPVAKKWKGRVETQLYITPSVVYRQLYDNGAGKNRSLNALNSFTNNTDVNNSVTQVPALGIEMGFNWLYQLPKGLKLKGGFQLNYTRYAIHAFDNHHPTATALSMNSSANNLLYEVFRSTPYSNRVGLDAVKLHNQTVQLSIPMGLDIKLAGNDNVEWYAGATIQPTYVLNGKSYLLSSDAKNYVKDNSMLNHFNMNAGFETYLSFKKDGYTLQVGPQLRTQLFSTNSKMFTIEERLQGYGLKIGISKKL